MTNDPETRPTLFLAATLHTLAEAIHGRASEFTVGATHAAGLRLRRFGEAATRLRSRVSVHRRTPQPIIEDAMADWGGEFYDPRPLDADDVAVLVGEIADLRCILGEALAMLERVEQGKPAIEYSPPRIPSTETETEHRHQRSARQSSTIVETTRHGTPRS